MVPDYISTSTSSVRSTGGLPLARLPFPLQAMVAVSLRSAQWWEAQ